jgi:ribosomal-protein-serine acetyltransferase
MFKLQVDEEIYFCLADPKYAQRMFFLINKDRDYLSQWLGWPKYSKQPSDYAEFAVLALKLYAEGKALPGCIEYRGVLVGAAGFNTIESPLKRAEIGYWLASDYQGRGIMTRVCRKLIDIAFNELQLEKVQLSAAEENLSSRAVAERLGMRLEGIITNAEAIDDRIVNHAVYGLLRSD